ncbi:S-protein homolog 29-like [Cicer arietinum]|uniref:S-protein homolog n=1 Tax=Cicer arietinum TaxID=3827 RepID=A0A1S2Z8V3_CICAR|nr:S-protein homolog 29-like [Cicer arietinum]
MHNVLGNHVTITNKLETGTDLIVHCKSADDDLGVHVLHFDQLYGFSFGDTFFGITQFYCSFKWNNELKWFDIYISGRDECETCNWTIKQSGPCLSSNTCYEWNK